MAFDNNIFVTGMVISAMPVGEYDTRVTILTKEQGKISAFARGARRPKSILMAGSRPFSFGRFEIYKGRNSNIISSIEISNYFMEITDDIESTYYGFYFLEIADYYSRENLDSKNMLKLLYQTLRALLNKNIPNRLIRVIYELKMLVYNGEYPEMFQCINCGSEQEIHIFSVLKGGMICCQCAAGVRDRKELDVSTIYTMQYIITSEVEKLYTFKVSKNVQSELENVMKSYLERYVDKSFKSLEILDMLEYNTMD